MNIFTNLQQHGITLTGYVRGPYKVVVPLSGGKDSQCCLKLALQEYKPDDVLAFFCDTQYEHPITYAHVEKVTKDSGVDMVILNAGSVLDVCTKYKRFPGGGARHCTDELKIRPSKFFYKYMAEKQGGFEVWLGMRSDESKEREARYRHKVSSELYAPYEVMPKYPKYLAYMGVMMRLPIIDWAKSEVFEFLEGGENPLYSHGFDRVGCFPCLAGGEGFQMMAFYFDDVGRKHYQIAEQIAEVAGRDVFRTKRYIGQGPGCAFCCI